MSQIDQHTLLDINYVVRPPWGLPEIYEIRFMQALSGVDRLTDRELQVFALLGLGMTNRMIARDLGVTERTVKAHVRQIFAKLGMDGRCEAAVVSFIWRSGMSGNSTEFLGNGAAATSVLNQYC